MSLFANIDDPQAKANAIAAFLAALQNQEEDDRGFALVLGLNISPLARLSFWTRRVCPALHQAEIAALHGVAEIELIAADDELEAAGVLFRGGGVVSVVSGWNEVDPIADELDNDLRSQLDALPEPVRGTPPRPIEVPRRVPSGEFIGQPIFWLAAHHPEQLALLDTPEFAARHRDIAIEVKAMNAYFACWRDNPELKPVIVGAQNWVCFFQGVATAFRGDDFAESPYVNDGYGDGSRDAGGEPVQSDQHHAWCNGFQLQRDAIDGRYAITVPLDGRWYPEGE